MAKVNIQEARVSVACDLYLAGRTEDGEDYHAESYYVVVERLDGHRLAHFKTFPGCIRHEDQDCGYVGFQDVREEAKADADNLVAAIEDVGSINDDHWAEVDPAYGSAYYCIMNGF